MRIPNLRHWPRLALLGLGAMLVACGSGPDAFSQADRDHDGKLSKQELGLTLLNAVFAAGDENGDAKITWEEWLKVDPKAAKKEFQVRDSNNDGAVTPAELKSYAEGRKAFDDLFADIDKNRDGFADQAELKEFHEQVMKAEGKTDLEKLINHTRQ